MKSFIVLACLVAASCGAALPGAKFHGRRFLPIFPNGRIVGGQPTTIEEVPYQLAFEWDGFQFCGASIISAEYALTAGHCIEGFLAEEVQVRTGSSNHESGGKVVQVGEIIPCADFVSETLDYDVALLKLSEPITLGAGSQPIPVGDAEPAAGDKLTVSGWGTLTEDGDTPDQLQSVVINTVDRDVCNEEYTPLFGGITDRMFCGGEKGIDSCQGDSGGPVVNENGEQVGIVSWGYGCARDGYPGIYTNIGNAEVRKFIKDNSNL